MVERNFVTSLYSSLEGEGQTVYGGRELCNESV